eukprot:scaffold100751_cov30-Tisochrysis_lutea.AAC.2
MPGVALPPFASRRFEGAFVLTGVKEWRRKVTPSCSSRARSRSRKMASESSVSPSRNALSSCASASDCARLSAATRSLSFWTWRTAILSVTFASSCERSCVSGIKRRQCLAAGRMTCAKARGSMVPSTSCGAVRDSQQSASAMDSCRVAAGPAASSEERVRFSMKLASASTEITASGEPGAAASTARTAGSNAAPSCALAL